MQAFERNTREAVFLLHGFSAHPKWMTLLSRRVAHTGRQVINWGYSSWLHSIDHYSNLLLQRVNQVSSDPTIDRLHFVTHSMGSIICRAALLKEHDRAKLGRVVMLGPPNRGSHVASFFNPLVGRFVPAVRELSTCPQSYVNGLASIEDVEVGVIAAGRDRIVALDRTHLPSQREHITVPHGHTGLLFSRKVARLAIHFLESGTFELEPATAAEVAVLGTPLIAPSLGNGSLGTAVPAE